MLSTEKSRMSRFVAVILFFAALWVGGNAYSQGQPAVDSICISSVTDVRFDRSGFDPRVDFRVKWRVMMDEAALDASGFDRYVISCSVDSSFEPGLTATLEGTAADSTALFRDMQANEAYYVKVAAYRRNGELAAESERFMHTVKFILPARPSLSPAYVVLWLLESAGFFDGAVEAMENSSPVGRGAFELIAVFLIGGLLVWCIMTSRILRSTRVFIVGKKINGESESTRAVKMATAHGLKDAKDLKLESFFDSTLSRRYFHEPLGWLERLSFWERLVKKRQNDRARFEAVPTVRILKSVFSAGNMREDVAGALEIRISAEEEELRKRSFIDVLWAFGVLAPLVGLFGTVTGIGQSFASIAEISPDDVALMRNLADGIFEALYTTIFGLITGILLMLAFYYYSYKLDRIHAIWAVFAAEFLDRLSDFTGRGGPSQAPGSTTAPATGPTAPSKKG